MYLLVAGDAKTNKANPCQREIYNNRSGNDNIQGGRTICERILLLVSLLADTEHGRKLTRVQKPGGVIQTWGEIKSWIPFSRRNWRAEEKFETEGQ